MATTTIGLFRKPLWMPSALWPILQRATASYRPTPRYNVQTTRRDEDETNCWPRHPARLQRHQHAGQRAQMQAQPVELENVAMPPRTWRAPALYAITRYNWSFYHENC